MGREASFELDCSDFSGSVTDFIKLLSSLGWSYYDDDNHAEYLPVGDRDSFDWQLGEITESGLYAIFDRKLRREETVGLVLYYRDTGHGITLLAADTSEILLIPNINRKTLDGDEDSVTDVNWYSEKIFQKLLWYDCGMVGFKFEEQSDSETEDEEESGIAELYEEPEKSEEKEEAEENEISD
ncbi:MAG: hypothetical protein IJM51_09850 [Clostridia bacterium]|nr:hypothetical protein [Clostridia bacterium]